MKALLIDTSSDTAYIGITQQGRLERVETLHEPRALSKTLLPLIASLWQAWDFIAVGIGPGSFTGTRVGATVAKTFAFALQIPLVTFSSNLLPNLEAIAALTHENFTSGASDSQIELVYFSKRL
jgi:tRNA threonylcarbamoyladenosine biosynthesis protein TsaB